MKGQQQRMGRVGVELNAWLQTCLQKAWVRRVLAFTFRFGGGFLLSRAALFDTWAPFGIGWQAAAGGGAGGLSALMGSIAGTISMSGRVESLKYIAVLVLVYAGAVIFRGTGLTRFLFFGPLTAGLVMAFVGIVFVAETGFTAASLLLYVTEILIITGSGYFYSLALCGQATGQTRRTISLLVLYATLLISLSDLSLIGGIVPARLAAGVYVLITAFRHGAGMGSGAGLAGGCAMDLALGYPYFSMSYGLAGLLSGVFRNIGKFPVAIVFVLTSAVAALWAGTPVFRLTALLETFVISVLFMLLPIRTEGKRVDTETEVPAEAAVLPVSEDNRTQEYVRRRLEQSALAFRELHTMLRSVMDVQRRDEDVAVVFTRATDTHCRQCALRALCWTQEMTATRGALRDATQTLAQRGRITASMLANTFTARCVKLDAFIRTVNDEMTALLSRRQYQSRLGESRARLCAQYGQMAGILDELAAELSRRVTFDAETEMRVTALLSNQRFPIRVTAARPALGRRFVELEGKGVGALLKEDREGLLDNISLSAGYPVSLPEQVCTSECEKLIFTEAEAYRASIGIASHKKNGQSENGDSGAWFKTADGRVFLLLSDGMGTGQAAGQESAQAVRLLERFLRAGIDPSLALSTLNSALVFRGDCMTEGFVTIDLCICNLMSGQVRLYKSGAAPSYIKRGRRVSRVSGQSFPVGLSGPMTCEADVTTLRLDAGDMAVMMSDGACEMGDEPWLSTLIEDYGNHSPKELAGEILQNALRHNGREDDIMVLVLSLDKRIR